MASLFAGIMSGTSLDAADAVLVEFDGAHVRTLAFASLPLPDALRTRLRLLCDPETDCLDLSGETSIALADVYADAINAVLSKSGLSAHRVSAIGCHGQTVRHRPELGFTIQLNDPARLAEKTGIAVVADFRRRDMAAGGQGAPLAPAFHHAVFGDPSCARAVVNIGGISNLSFLDGVQAAIGFDCGPGNVLMDAWVMRHRRQQFDRDGAWAAQGRVIPPLLARMRADPYFALAPPKSTGRELFNVKWLDAMAPSAHPAEDVQATLLEFTATTILDCIEQYAKPSREIYLCGGGARNRALAARLGDLALGRRISTTDALGIAAEAVEAAAFAWFAMKCVRREPVELGAITGAVGPRILGAIYPA